MSQPESHRPEYSPLQDMPLQWGLRNPYRSERPLLIPVFFKTTKRLFANLLKSTGFGRLDPKRRQIGHDGIASRPKAQQSFFSIFIVNYKTNINKPFH